MAKPLDLPRDV